LLKKVFHYEVVTEFVIEIGIERTRLFPHTLFHHTDHLTTFVTEVMIHFSDRAMLVLKNCD